MTVAIVTGSSRGIGRAIALRLGAEGLNVVVNYRAEAAAAESVVAEIAAAGGKAIAVGADVRDPAAVRSVFDAAEREFGGLDVLVSNAGLNRPTTIAEATDEQYDLIFDTNTRATFLALREAARRIRDGGRIVTISSTASVMARPGGAIYSASKAAADALVRGLAKEIGGRQVTVNSVLPGATRTPALETAPESAWRPTVEATPLGRMGEPEDIADVVAFLVSDAGRWITGQAIRANGGYL